MDKRYEHKDYEAKIRSKWDQEKTYAQEQHEGPMWSIDTPPPTVSGNLHIGHIFSYTQTDIVARYKRMRGFSVYYPFGFDDNGLPTERYIEKKCNVYAPTIGRSAFIDLCLKETHEAEQQFMDLWQRMGLSVNWEHCYSTISPQTRKISQQSFIELVNKGYIYRKHEPALYCTTCRTSVAQAELDDHQEASFFNDIVFKDEQGNPLIIGTTRPELLYSCVALLYHPQDERYQHLAGKQAQVPLAGHMVPILADDLVSMEKGTGLVMCCTFGDKTDILWFKKHNLPYKQSIGFDGKWTADTGSLAGLKVADARTRVVQELEAHKALINRRPIEHSVSLHERCKKPIEYLMLKQWFLNILDYKQEFIALAEQISWYPAFMKARYVDWVQNLNWDWCLSRQRFFGIPFPVWHVEGTDKFLLPPVSALPIDPQETAYPGEVPAEFAGRKLIADTDVMDTWNTSSLTPYICYQMLNLNPQDADLFSDAAAQKFIPMSMRPQAHDIIRTWAFYTIVKSWMHNKQIPWSSIVISGHVLADAKEKLSKSKGNASLSPENLLQTYSADTVRYWTASGNLGQDVAFSDNQLKIGTRLVTKLWNAFRFIYEHTQEVDVAAKVTLSVEHQWLVHEASATYTSYEHYLEKNEFGLALKSAEEFFWQHFCDNFLELVKDQLFNPDAYDAARVAATRWTLAHVGLRILQWFAPYMPFVTETLYEAMYKSKVGIASLHATKFLSVQQDHIFPRSVEIMNVLLAIVAQVRKLKTEQQLALNYQLASLTIGIHDTAMIQDLQAAQQLIKGATKAELITFEPKGTIQTHMRQDDTGWHAYTCQQAKE
jgi:valyl-tRNA synthetase